MNEPDAEQTMEMKGSRVVPASVEQTWQALNDPDALKACIAGCETVERVSDNEFRVVMTARVGPVSAKFNGRISLTDVVPPTSYTLRFEGQGGAAGFANGEAQVALAAEEQGTRIDYAAKAQVGGKLAQIGSRLIDGVAAKVADDFFACFAARLGAAPEPAAAVPGPPDVQAVAMRRLWIRLALAIVIVAAMAIYWMTRPVVSG
ncbi:MAG: carbon monoxide dehydrogenase subunit G [Betaproteobacteria bacterium]